MTNNKKIYNSLKIFINKKKKFLCYLFFGIMTTLVNFLSLWVLNGTLGLNEILANSLAWIVAVTFAFLTNKYFVFKAKHSDTLLLYKEALSFYSGRLVTLLIDNLFIFVFVTKMSLNLFLIKVISEFIIVIFNYFLGKYIFTKNKTADLKI